MLKPIDDGNGRSKRVHVDLLRHAKNALEEPGDGMFKKVMVTLIS